MLHAGTVILSGFFSLTACAANPPARHLIERVQSRQFDVHYDLDADPEPATTVELWYTFDQGSTWHRYGYDVDQTSPMTVTAPQEGLCGLYLVAVNSAGASSDPPRGDTQPHKWVFIDFTPPIVQLHPPVVHPASDDGGLIDLRWSVVDDHLTPRPIDLAFQSEPDESWLPIAENLPNSGRYEWKVPADAAHVLAIRLTATDRGGNRARAVVMLPQQPAVQLATHQVASTTESAQSDKDTPKPVPAPTAQEKSRAEALVRQARQHWAAGRVDRATESLREAVKLDPTRANWLVELGKLLYAQRDLEESDASFRRALELQPDSLQAMIGAAQTTVRQRRFSDAKDLLMRAVELYPDDVESWLHLGDVEVYRGDELSAREYYGKAVSLAPPGSPLAERARKRQALVTTLTERFSQQPDPTQAAQR